MNWISSLVKTYDKYENLIYTDLLKDDTLKGKIAKTMVPIFHTAINSARFNVILDVDGKLLDIQPLEEDEVTFVPVTAESVSRTSGRVPHALNDNLPYLSSDYYTYRDWSESKIESFAEAHKDYMDRLSEWYNYDKNPQVGAVLKYLKKSRLTKDIVKYVGDFDDEPFIRFVVVLDDDISETWKNKKLIKSWQNFYKTILSQTLETDVSFISGKNTLKGRTISAKIRNAGDSAKLISTNAAEGDKTRFVGQYQSVDNLCSYGYEEVEKAVSALRYLAYKQGKTLGSGKLIIWSSSSAEISLDVIDDTDFFDFDNTDSVSYTDIGYEYSQKVLKKILGYKQTIKDTDNIYILYVDTADGSSQGRLSVGNLITLSSNDFFENISNFHRYCSWITSYKSDNGIIQQCITSPLLRDIVNAVYGKENNKGFLSVESDSISKKKTLELINSVTTGKRLPHTLSNLAFSRTWNRNSYTYNNWRKVCYVACALIAKEYKDYYNKEVKMSLDSNEITRSYLFGQLMALLEAAENYYLYKTGKQQRETTVVKNWKRIKLRPATTFEAIFTKLKNTGVMSHTVVAAVYSEKISKVMSQLAEIDGYTDARLEKDYIIGYTLTTHELRNKKEEDNSVEE